MRTTSFIRLGLGLGLALVIQACPSKLQLPYTPNIPAQTVTVSPTPTLPFTPAPSATPTNSPTPTVSATPSASPTKTLTSSSSFTPSSTPTGTQTALTPLISATPTLTGCGKTGDGPVAFPTVQPDPVSGGTTAVGLSFNVGLCCTTNCIGGQYPVFTGFSLATTVVSGNLASSILAAQLWSGGTLLDTKPFTAGTLSFSGFSSTTLTYSVEYVLAPGAYGTVTTTLPAFGGFSGYLQTLSGTGMLWPEPGSFNGLTGTLNVADFTPTPTGTWATSTPTVTPTPTITSTPTVTATSTPTNVLGSFTTIGGSAYFSQGPAGIQYSAGNLWVVDYGGSLQEWTVGGTQLKTIQTFNAGQSFSNPWGDGIDPATGNVYVADPFNRRVEVFDPTGNYLTAFGNAELSAAGDTDYGLAVNSAGTTVYVAANSSGKIFIFSIGGTSVNPTFVFQTTFGNTLPRSLSNPLNLRVGTNGNLWVADYGFDLVREFDGTGNVLQTFTSGLFREPEDVLLAPNGDLYVVDRLSNLVFILNSAGTVIGQFGAGIFGQPMGITTDGAGNFYVTDFNNKRIVGFH